MNTNITAKKDDKKIVEVVSRRGLSEGLNKKINVGYIFEGEKTLRVRKTDKFNENFILDLIKINIETDNIFKEFIDRYYSHYTLEEREELIKSCYFNFKRKKVFKFSEDLEEEIKRNFNPLYFDKIMEIFTKYTFKRLKKYKYLYFFLYLLNSSNRRTENNIAINLPIILQSIFSFFEVENEKVKLYENQEEIKEKLKEKLELWVKKKEIGTTYQEFTVRWNYKRVTKNITDDFVKEVNKLSVKDYKDYSKMRNPYLQKSLYLVYIISLNNMFKYFDFLNNVVIKECLFKDDLAERMSLKKGIIYRYEKEYTDGNLTKEKYDVLKMVENELIKEGKKIW